MEIRSDDGARVRIRPVGYQPGVGPPDDPDDAAEWDDWLLVETDARTADGQAWSHLDPCLTVVEAYALAGWLRGWAGTAGPAEPEAVVRFTEPNLAFRARLLRRRRLALTVEFSSGSLPPWLPRRPLNAVYPLTLAVSADALAAAARQWAREADAYPRRAVA
ncbi:WapI family immunity protein [Micromonospora sp. KLBMP9576]|uniref:WapI family immunity protein n=1 Tax=Micromonospora sp. KLBMP9576 TaxID=3424769 RepID=UPI003D8D5C5C